jgi:hypothetical protein
MKYLLIISIIIFLTAGACTTERRCAIKYPQQIITKDCVIYKDVIKQIIIHDTLFIIGDTVHSTDTVYVLDGLIHSSPVFATVDFANAKAQVINSKLFLDLFQNDTAIARFLTENVIIKEKDVFKTETIIKKVWLVHWYDKVARVIAGIFILAIIVLFAINIIKAYLKPF